MTINDLKTLRERTSALSSNEQSLLAQGFRSDFWRLVSAQVKVSYDSLSVELETCQAVDRIRTIQGEIAAIRILLDWAGSYLKPRAV